jgi:hypothetical protein
MSLPRPNFDDVIELGGMPDFPEKFAVSKKSARYPNLAQHIIDNSFIVIGDDEYICLYAISKITKLYVSFEKRECGLAKNRGLYLANARLARDHARDHGLNQGIFQLN